MRVTALNGFISGNLDRPLSDPKASEHVKFTNKRRYSLVEMRELMFRIAEGQITSQFRPYLIERLKLTIADAEHAGMTERIELANLLINALEGKRVDNSEQKEQVSLEESKVQEPALA
jgi:hypothetical protein